MSDVPTLRAATPDDRSAIERLLRAAALPTDGVADLLAAHADDFVVADDPERPGSLTAAAGLEVCGPDALLRSVAVHAGSRAHGVGAALVQALVRRAESRGLRSLYLLTTTAADYFPRFGFARVARDVVPPDIAGTVEFRGACPASAVAMRRALSPTPDRRA